MTRTTRHSSLARCRRLSLLACALAAGGCGLMRKAGGGGEGPDVQSLPPPVTGAALDTVETTGDGLLQGLAPDGTPLADVPQADPRIVEARRFYDTLRTPVPEEVAVDYPDPFTGENTPTRYTAPLTLDDWKRVFNLPAQQPGEDLQAYRDRTGVAVYYNRNELAVGRQIGCATFVDGYDAAGAPLYGIACFVTNHGNAFRAGAAALQAAIDDVQIRNTVCITYRPTLDPGYEVQFYVYGASGKRLDWALLDTLGPRPHPAVCMSCHGGAYDNSRHLAMNARFLPIDPNVVTFADPGAVAPGVTRDGQEERIRVINQMAAATPLTPAQRAFLNGLYPAGVNVAGSVATGDGVPATWNANAADHDFYAAVVKPYCGTCHLAAQLGLTAVELPGYQMLASPAAFDRAPLMTYVCGTFSMPNAQPTSLAFWDAVGNAGVNVAGMAFPTPADALLARRNLDRATCPLFVETAGCDRGPDPGALCGGAARGATCDLASGRCVPMVTGIP